MRNFQRCTRLANPPYAFKHHAAGPPECFQSGKNKLRADLGFCGGLDKRQVPFQQVTAKPRQARAVIGVTRQQL